MTQMIRRQTSVIVLLGLLAPLLALADDATQPPAAWTVTPVSIEEQRSRDLTSADEHPFNEGLRIRLQVAGPGADDATAYGQFIIKEAADDAGDDLIPKESGGFGRHDKDMTNIDSMSRKFRHDNHQPGVEVELALKSARRSAVKLTQVSGNFILRTGGAEQKVVAANLPALDGKTIDDAALKAAAITVTVDSARAQADSLKLKIKGNLAAIREVQLLSPDGRDQISGHSAFSFGDTQSASYDLRAPLDAAMKLQITVIVGQNDVAVPFELKDVALP